MSLLALGGNAADRCNKCMFKYIISVIVALVSMGLAAQEHLSFMGIPIDGSLKSFTSKLKDKGMKETLKKTDYVMLDGTFAGIDASIFVLSGGNDNVYGVSVSFPDSDQWNNLLSTYNYFKELYVEKYGAYEECIEQIPVDAEEHGNSWMMHELNGGNIVYQTAYLTEGGGIMITIAGSVIYPNGYVSIVYTDFSNYQRAKQHILDDL